MKSPFLGDCKKRLITILQDALSEGTPTADGFTWTLGDATTTVKLIEEDPTGEGEACVGVVDIRTTAKRDAWQIDSERMGTLNALAGLSAFVAPARKGQCAPLVSRVPLFDDGRMDAEAVVALVFTTAVLQSAWLRGAAEWVATSVMGEEAVAEALEGSAASQSLPLQDEPSSWAGEDFKPLAKELSEAGVRSVGREGSLSAQVEWAPGAVSAKLSHRTAVLLLESRLEHPFLGNGLACTLQLPVQFDADGARGASRELNLLESKGGAFPFLGAWCPDPSAAGHVSFASFLPNCVFSPGLADAVAAWMIARAHATADWLTTK